MPLTPNQRKAVQKAPAAKRSAMAANFNNQNNVRKGQNQRSSGRSRGRGRRNNTISTRTKSGTGKIPASVATSFSRTSSDAVTITDEWYIPLTILERQIPFSVQGHRLVPQSSPWLDQFAGLYSRWKFNSCRWRYVTSTSAFTSGSVALCYDASDEDLKPTSLESMQRMSGFAMHHVAMNSPQWYTLPKHLSDRWFSTRVKKIIGETDQLNTTPAQVYTAFIGNFTFNSTPGTLEVHMSISFADKYTLPRDVKKRPGEIQPPVNEAGQSPDTRSDQCNEMIQQLENMLTQLRITNQTDETVSETFEEVEEE